MILNVKIIRSSNLCVRNIVLLEGNIYIHLQNCFHINSRAKITKATQIV